MFRWTPVMEDHHPFLPRGWQSPAGYFFTNSSIRPKTTTGMRIRNR